MTRLRAALWMLVAVVALAAIALVVVQQRSGRGASDQPAQPSIGRPFTLIGSNGKPFSSARLMGKPYAVFFGFTRCPDTCPTTLAQLTRLRSKLTQGPDSLAIVFVSVDPDRDGPNDVGRYSELFGSPVIGLTGTRASIEQVKKQFGVFSQKAAISGEDYSVDHTASVFLMDRDGRFARTISPGENDEVALQKLELLTN